VPTPAAANSPTSEPNYHDAPLFPRGNFFPFFLVTALFFLWGIPNNLNDVLIRQFMKSFAITRFQAGLIQSAFYLGYFVLAMPAALLMRKLGHKAGFINPVPAVIFLYGEYCAMPRPEADHFIDELLETSAIAFGLKDSRSPNIWWFPGEQREIAHYIAAQTGGQYLQVTPETFATGLEESLRQLHFRYELGFKAETLDGKRHKLRVNLADFVKNQHKGVREMPPRLCAGPA